MNNKEVKAKKVFLRTYGWPMDVAKTDYACLPAGRERIAEAILRLD